MIASTNNGIAPKEQWRRSSEGNAVQGVKGAIVAESEGHDERMILMCASNGLTLSCAALIEQENDRAETGCQNRRDLGAACGASSSAVLGGPHYLAF